MKRGMILMVVWVLGVGAGVCLVGQGVGAMWYGVYGEPLEWQRQVGNRQYIWGIGGGSMYGVRVERPTVRVAQGANETGVASVGLGEGERSFGVGRWERSRRVAYYSTVPNDRYDPAKVGTYRSEVQFEKLMVWVDAWRLVGVLGVWPMVVAARGVYRYVGRRREYYRGHCRGCGYDLRATPERCPECGRGRINGRGTATL